MRYKLICAVLAALLTVSAAFNAVLVRRDSPDMEPLHTLPQTIDGANEEYVYIAALKDSPLIQEQDEKGLRAFAQEMGVNVVLEAPESYDVVAVAQLIEQTIARRPAGIMICGAEKSLLPYINKAVEAGIPTITVDADLPGSNRLAFVGSDWYQIGVKQAEGLVRQIGGKGLVATFGIVGADNTDQALDGFNSVLKDYEDIVILDMYDDISDAGEAERMAYELLADYPQIAGIAGFDSTSAIGICAALRKEKKSGIVKVVSVDMTPAHIQLLQDGDVQQLVGQKRELFTYYGGKLLYSYNHDSLKIINSSEQMHITNIPEEINTGLVVLTANDIS